jgi:hypothetical protein
MQVFHGPTRNNKALYVLNYLFVSESLVCVEYNLTECNFFQDMGFLSHPKRFNVATTRAQALQIVIGDPFLLHKDRCEKVKQFEIYI